MHSPNLTHVLTVLTVLDADHVLTALDADDYVLTVLDAEDHVVTVLGVDDHVLTVLDAEDHVLTALDADDHVLTVLDAEDHVLTVLDADDHVLTVLDAEDHVLTVLDADDHVLTVLDAEDHVLTVLDAEDHVLTVLDADVLDGIRLPEILVLVVVTQQRENDLVQHNLKGIVVAHGSVVVAVSRGNDKSSNTRMSLSNWVHKCDILSKRMFQLNKSRLVLIIKQDTEVGKISNFVAFLEKI